MHPAPGRCILRSIEQTFVDRLCTTPQAAAFSSPWSNHLWTAGASRPKLLHSQVHGGNICGPLEQAAPSCCILSSMEETFVDRWCIPPQAAAFSGPWSKHLWTTCAPRPRPLHSQVHGSIICGALVHPAPGRCILRSMEQTSVDRWCTPPQAAAFSGPWSKHQLTLVHILRSMEQTSMDRWCTPLKAAALSGSRRKYLWTAGAPCLRPLHSEIHGANIYTDRWVTPPIGRCILSAIELTPMDRLCFVLYLC